MKLKIFALILCLCVCVSALTGCSNQYNFQYAFFPVEVVALDDTKELDFTVTEIDEKYIELINNYLTSLTSFVNDKFSLNISKPSPKVKGYIPTRGTLASYTEGTIYLYVDGITDDEIFGIIHELIHYLSDNGDNLGFIHKNLSQGKPTTWGFGLTEGFTDLITVMYLQENNLPLPKHIEEKTDCYSELRDLAQVYYALEPQTIPWLFNSDYKSMTNFTYTSLNSVAVIPDEYNDIEVFDLYFYAYQDVLMRTTTGVIDDVFSYKLMYTSSFEIAAVTVRACQEKKVKKNIYNEILSDHDQDNTIKNMIFS